MADNAESAFVKGSADLVYLTDSGAICGVNLASPLPLCTVVYTSADNVCITWPKSLYFCSADKEDDEQVVDIEAVVVDKKG